VDTIKVCPSLAYASTLILWKPLTPMQSRPRTSRQEAAELSNVIQQTTEVIEQRKEHQKRQVGIYC